MTTTERQQAGIYLGLIQSALADDAGGKDRSLGRAALALLYDLVGEAHGAESHARRPRKAKAATEATA